ncbi:hypothetical protein [Hydrogenophaga pseudoflava]|uniref:hypothetical protein n=1 Tax=Hydrogenophaga pseudoflava TaxID=47421 RepID=UPI0027E55FBD|nr:hypothetical protein [Hydrogenophaga pseudoflava]MDQ7744268.1 hypothetical protein [Hydrogenophaga pseudoflava]
MKSNECRAAMHWSTRRVALKLTLAGVLAAGLSACGGGGGGDESSEDSKDLRAALDRLQAGMTYDEVVAAVGWEPNEGPDNWSHDGRLLMVTFQTPANASERRIAVAVLAGRPGESEIHRRYQ